MAATTTFRKICRKPRPDARCSRTAAQPATERTTAVCTDAFLKHRFAACWGIANRDWKKTEREFFCSLSHLCRLYGWQQPDVSGLYFPENVHAAWQQVNRKFEASDLDCIIGQDDHRKVALATVKTFHVGMTLYYIPVRPLWHMLEKNPDKTLPLLLVEICSYFLGRTGISFFNRNGYLYNTYEYMQNMVEDGEEEDEVFREIQREELARMRIASDILFEQMNKPFAAEQAETLLKQYRDTNDCHPATAELCDDCIRFAKDFPKESLYKNFSTTMLLAQETEYIYYDQYISFYWSGADCFTDLLIDIVNADLQEVAEMQQPIALQWFDTEQSCEQHALSYETRLFSLLDRLIELLNDYDHEKHQ